MKEGGLAVPDLKLYYKAVVIKTIWYWLRNRREDRWEKWKTVWERLGLDQHLTPYIRINSEWLNELNRRKEIIKKLGEHIGIGKILKPSKS